MRRSFLPIATFLVSLAATSTQAEPQGAVSVAVLADTEQGRSLDADATVSNGSWWGLGGGGGVTRSESALGILNGTSERALAEVQHGELDVRGYYRHWQANLFENQTVGARPSWSHAGLTLAAIAEWREFSTQYSTGGASSSEQAARFSGSGFGAGLKYVAAPWSASLEGIWYSFHSLTSYVASQNALPSTPAGSALLPILAGPVGRQLPGLTSAVLGVAPSLTSSVVTLNQSALQHLVTLDLGRDVGRGSVHLDWINARDAILQTTINSYSATYRQPFAGHWNASVTLGTNDSSYTDATFGGLNVGVDF